MGMRTLEHLPAAKQRGMAKETLHVFAPLANRLGIWNVKAELEDLCFKHLEPEQYERLKSGVNNERNLGLLLQALDALNQRLDAIYDACALRVIVDSEEESYAVLEEVHALWEPLPQKTKQLRANWVEPVHTLNL